MADEIRKETTEMEAAVQEAPAEAADPFADLEVPAAPSLSFGEPEAAAVQAAPAPAAVQEKEPEEESNEELVLTPSTEKKESDEELVLTPSTKEKTHEELTLTPSPEEKAEGEELTLEADRIYKASEITFDGEEESEERVEKAMEEYDAAMDDAAGKSN